MCRALFNEAHERVAKAKPVANVKHTPLYTLPNDNNRYSWLALTANHTRYYPTSNTCR